MLCPFCKQECEVSELQPVFETLKLEGAIIHAKVRVADLCSGCYEELQSGVIDMTRPFDDLEVMKPHLDHDVGVTFVSAKRTEALPGYIGLEAVVALECNCSVGAGPITRKFNGSCLAVLKP